MERADKREFGLLKKPVSPKATLVVEIETREGTHLLETVSMQKTTT